MKHLVKRLLTPVMAASMLFAQSVAALDFELPDFGTLIPWQQSQDQPVTASYVRVQMDISDQEAAERLSYLGIVSGTVATDGKKVFELERNITRLELLVIVTRLMGSEQEAKQYGFSHPYTDVPEWGSPYVGYFFMTGLLPAGTRFDPDGAVSTKEFMTYMYYALGYGMGGNAKYDSARAADYGRLAGICGEALPSVTRGEAFLMILRTLQTNRQGTETTLAETLAANGVFPKNDVFYYTLCTDKDATAKYVLDKGAAAQESEREGVYTVKLVGSERCLNVAVEGENKDYDGVPLTMWEATGDVTQSFRIVLDNNGYYVIYASASGGGHNRMIGFADGGRAGLYAPFAEEAEKFVIRKAEGGYQILSASNTNLALSSRDTQNLSPVSLQPVGTYGFKQTWTFETEGIDLLFQEGTVTPTMLLANTTVPRSAAATRIISRRNEAIPDAVLIQSGEYVVSLPATGFCLNVAVNGANKDYNGVTVNLYEMTGDVSQMFRAALTESGTYKLYSCASNGGYKRVIGFSSRGKMGLYDADSRYASEFVIVKAEGGYRILDAGNPEYALGVASIANNGAVELVPLNDPGYATIWSFDYVGTANSDGYEYAVYPNEYLYVTQGRYDRYSHFKQNAIDVVTDKTRVFAPFSCEIVRIDRGYYSFNAVWIQSNAPVVYADGSVDYMTICFMHDNDISDLTVGQRLMQGDPFYDMGVAGGASGSHVHIAVYRGKYEKDWVLTGSGDVDAEDAFFLLPTANVVVDYEYDWVRMP